MEKVGKVDRLLFYPVKSMTGYDVTELDVTFNGLRSGDIEDRQWAVLTPAGLCLDGRMQPRLCLIKPSFHGDMLHLDAEGMETLKIPRDISQDSGEVKSLKMFLAEKAVGVDCGDEAGLWLSMFLKKDGLRLVYAAPGLHRRYIKQDGFMGPHVQEKDQINYHDCAPVMLISEASMQDLNSRLKKPADVVQFRCNIVASETAGPCVEDDWKELHIGDSIMTVAAVAPRCTFPNIDPKTGKRDPENEPIRTLKTYRHLEVPESMKKYADSPSFGVWLSVIKPGKISVGDAIFTVKK